MKRTLEPIAFESIPFAAAKRIHDGFPEDEPDWESHRVVAKSPDDLSPSALQWMDRLPATVRPLDLASDFPRIVNRISALWNQPEPCRKYLTELLIVGRKKRQGFPLAIVSAISDLTAYFTKLNPEGRPWS